MKSTDVSSRKQVKFFGIPKLLPYLAPYKGVFLALIFGSLLTGVLNSAIPLFQRYAIEKFIGGGTLEGFAPFVATYVSALVLGAALSFIGFYGCSRIEMFVLRDMRTSAFSHLQTLSVGYFNRHSVGALHARIMSDTSAVSEIVSWDVHEGVYQIAYVVTAIVVMFRLNEILALCCVVILPVVALVTVFFQKKITRLSRETREINSQISGDFNEGICGVETSKTLTIEDKLDENFTAHTCAMRKKSQRLGHHKAVYFALISFFSSVALAEVLWYGGVITTEGLITVATLSVFMNYAQGLMSPVSWAVGAISDAITIKVNMERFCALLESVSDVADTPEVIEKYGDSFNPKTENFEPLLGDIRFDDVTFKYPDGDEYVLEHFNLNVPRGTNVAIVGETGAGKSTLVNLVCRFFEPTEGRVLIDGRDARERSVHWLHSNIGYVLQTPHLFSGTVRENLRYGKADATDEEMTEAVNAVNAGFILERLEGGLDAVIGEGGNNLSTGEKQLLSFARAILVKPAIFILDEATSSIDTLTEKLIQDAIETLMRGRTSFVIAHRLSTVRSADIILVVSDGKIIERGTHEELLRLHGYYYDLYIRQFQEDNLK